MNKQITKIYLTGVRGPVLVSGHINDVARSLSYMGHRFVFFETVDKDGTLDGGQVGIVSSQVVSVKTHTA